MIDIPAGWAAVLVAVLGLGGAGLGVLSHWLAGLSKRLRTLEHRDKLSWLYIRSLIDHAYRHGAVPLPEPPEGWMEETE